MENQTIRNGDKNIPIVGNKFKADFGANVYELDFLSETQLHITTLKGTGENQTVSYQKKEIRPQVYMVTWQEKDKTTVTHVEDFANGYVYTNITFPDLSFAHYEGPLTPVGETVDGDKLSQIQQDNIETVKAFLIKAFNENDIDAASQLVTERYIQHNPFVKDGRSGFVEGITAMHRQSPSITYDFKHIYVDGDFVITHSQQTKNGEKIAVVDIFRMLGGKIDEHWDVSQTIPDPSEAANDNTMF